ncbi:asparagine synthase-related protein (plasmid) [Klebsiella sp. B345]|uniref:asparagine synthase-related protein n=1 Tax=Klebsiella sp. B345 TaxID=2755398 RepID=UPI003DAA269A
MLCGKPFIQKKTPDALTEIVSDAVKTILNSYSDINLYLSGGLDSTYLFFIIKELKYDFTTYHIGPENDQNDSEIDDFRYLCNYYSVNGQVLHTKRSEIIPLNNRSLLNNPRYVKLFNNKVTNSEVYINKTKSVQSVFLVDMEGIVFLFKILQ